MINFSHYLPTRFVFGRGVEDQTGEQVRALGATKVLIHYGGGSAVRSGLIARVEASLDAAGVKHVSLGGAQPNPRDTKVYEGIDLIRREKVDFVLAVGGGSAIDSAKAMAHGALYDGDFWDFFCGKAKPEKTTPLGVVLTMSAAGSESSDSCVITQESTKTKRGLNTELNRPLLAIMDPELTMTQPAYQTACGCVDIMAHVMDSYFTRTPDCVLTDNMSLAVLKTVVEFAPIALKEPENYHARAELMWASTLGMSGLLGVDRITCLNGHALGEDFGGLYDLTHGATLAIVEPALLTYKLEEYLPRLVRFAKEVWQVEGTDDRAVALEGLKRMKEFFSSMGVPVTFSEVGIDIEKDGRMLADRIEAFEADAVYVDLSHEDVYQVYMLAK